jgi:hypothetical protein
VDYGVHAVIADHHRLAVVLPETAAAGAGVFAHRLADQLVDWLREQGVSAADALSPTVAVLPGDEAVLASLRSEFSVADHIEHPLVTAGPSPAARAVAVARREVFDADTPSSSAVSNWVSATSRARTSASMWPAGTWPASRLANKALSSDRFASEMARRFASIDARVAPAPCNWVIALSTVELVPLASRRYVAPKSPAPATVDPVLEACDAWCEPLHEMTSSPHTAAIAGRRSTAVGR